VVPVGEAVVIAAALGVALNDLTADPGTILPVRAGAWPLMDFISEIRKMIETQQAAYGDAADKLTDFELRLGKLGLELRPSGPKEG
jgi:hypothetical protein